MKLSDYVAEFVSKLSPRVYTVCGAGAMHLNDSICHHPGIKAIAMHHEQAATMAAEADARVTNGIGVVCVTAGPGGTNTLTGLAGAWVDSIPLLVIAGQATSSTMMTLPDGHVRAQGMNELPMVDIVGPVTKLAITVNDPGLIRHYLQAAYDAAMQERRGPVWIEIPLDIQAAEIDPETLEYAEWRTWLPSPQIEHIDALPKASRPVMIIGNGIRLSGAEDHLRRFLDRFRMPIVTSWGARDIIPGHPCVIGSGGIFGDRASNWTIQNADLILAVGTRLSYPQTGHNRELFAPDAIKIVVDIDDLEASKLPCALPIVADCKEFFDRAVERLPADRIHWESWLNACHAYALANPVMLPEYREGKGGINAYHFIEQLGQYLANDAIVITDVGFSFIPTFQSLKLKPGQRLIHSAGVSSMGYAIPAAVGAAFATDCKRQIVCLTGDGGAMMNLQELATIAHHKLPISIFVYANDGYATMRLTQENHFGRLAVSNEKTGVSCPHFEGIADMMGFPTTGNWRHETDGMFEHAFTRELPALIHMDMAPNQIIAPRVQSRMESGKFVPTPIDDMWPYREKAEAAE